MKKNKIGNVLNQSLDIIMSDRFGRYSKYIIQGRALPDVRDGLKPVQRRILFSMSELGLTNNKPFKKSARVVGDVIGKYHPHGDSSIYEAMVRMSQDWKTNYPLVEMHGNNGSIDDDPAAAMRYTESRLSKISSLLIEGIKKDTVNFAPNFDDSEKEPTVLPGLLPNLLINGAKGIAAGYATEMPPHNLKEVIDAIIAKIKSPNAHLSTILKYIKGPDFPTGGTVLGSDGIYMAFERGKGKIAIRSKYQINNSKTNPSIIISEIPYGVIKSKLTRQIDEIRANKKVSGIKEVRDDSGRNGISIFIGLTPGTDANIITKYLLSKTDMQIYYNYNNIAIRNQRPIQLSIIELIDAYLKHQKEVQKRAISFDLAKDLRKLEIVEGLIKVANNSDSVIDAIRKARGSRQGVIESLIAKFKFTSIQANAIADLKLYRLSSQDQDGYKEEAQELNVRIKRFKELLNDPVEFDRYLINLLKEIKNIFGTERKTLIEGEIEKIEVDMDKLIKHEEVWISISKEGYLKRFSNRAYEANELKDFTLKEDDSIVYLNKVNTSNKLLAFTDDGKYVFIPIHKIIETKFKDIGKHINDHAQISPDSKIISAIVVKNFDTKANIIIATNEGKIKRTEIKEFEVARYSKALMSIKLSKTDKVVSADISNNNSQIIVIASTGKAVKYPETEIAKYGTKSSGIKGISLPKNTLVTNMFVARNEDTVGLLSKRGGAKRIKVSTIEDANRNTQGKQMFRLVKGNPHLVIDSSIVFPKSQGLFIDNKNNKKIFTFNTIDITSVIEGFSQVGTSQTKNGKILNFKTIDSSDDFFKKNNDNSNEKEVMEAAEKKINSIDQISIDDLIEGL